MSDTRRRVNSDWASGNTKFDDFEFRKVPQTKSKSRNSDRHNLKRRINQLVQQDHLDIFEDDENS
jgi:hypothetical protein